MARCKHCQHFRPLPDTSWLGCGNCTDPKEINARYTVCERSEFKCRSFLLREGDDRDPDQDGQDGVPAPELEAIGLVLL